MTIAQTQKRREINTAICTACRACEIACHYHHKATFSTSASSIRVKFDPDSGEIMIQFNNSCDYCQSEPEPLCVQFCEPGVIFFA